MRALLSSRPINPAALAGCVILVALVGCAGQDAPATASADGALFARGLKDISEYYIRPVSSRQLALAGAARLSRLDGKLAVGDSFGSRFAGALTLSYDGRDVALVAEPPDNDTGRWSATIDNIVATAKRASPKLAALPQATIDNAILGGMTRGLDRFSRYAPPDQARDQRAARDGFSGIGVTLDTADDAYRVTAVTEHSPAERAGIRPEDQIVAIDGVATAGCPHHEVIERLRGPIGSAVDVKIRPPGGAASRDLLLRRDYVVLPTVTMSQHGGVAVFHIASFNHSTARRVAEGLAQAQRQAGGRLAGIVLDLRGDPGGLLDQAVALAELFIPNGPIVSTIGRHPASFQRFAATGNAVAPSVPIAVLVNGGSASAAEIVAAALQDRGRAVVVGSSSYGKGTVQTVLRLPNDGEFIVTWAGLVTPSGYLLQSHGVVPTICTAALPDDSGGVETGLRQLAAGGAPASPRRAGLDEAGWAALRASCPPRHVRPAVDLQLAERLLTSPPLYSAALNALPGGTQVASGAPPARALTAADPALSSRQR